MISVFLDTNILYSRSTDFTVAGFLSNINGLIGEIEVNDIYDKVQLVVPRIVIEELKRQQLDSYSDWVSKIKKVRFTEQRIEFHTDYEAILTRIFDAAIEHLTDSSAMVKTCIAEYPPDQVLSLLIKRALDKKPPFEGKEKESDKGFKDAIIWETLLAFKEQNPQDILILFSKDARITDKYLKDEYESRFNEEILLIQRKDMNSYKDVLCPIFDLVKEEKMRSTYAQELNEHLLSLICSELIEPLYDGEIYSTQDGDFIIDSLGIGSPEIFDTFDEGDQSIYTVNIPIGFHCSNRDEIMFIDEEPYSFDFTYSFIEKGFRLKSYTLPDGGVVELSEPLEVE